mmetsp:Transcript_31195/g.47772  ORF Transcript_31195/g.47772 Transcript_31195/m.47772 type:complete len:86 (+) Transcript_31195:1858-2115(+)
MKEEVGPSFDIYVKKPGMSDEKLQVTLRPHPLVKSLDKQKPVNAKDFYFELLNEQQLYFEFAKGGLIKPVDFSEPLFSKSQFIRY